MRRYNSESKITTYLHQKGRRLGLPIAGNFEITPRCNFNCPMCYVHMTQEQVDAAGKELTAGQWLELAKEARDCGMVFALLTGGEPLVRKDFFEIYDGMREMGILVSINSNGSMLSGKILERFLEAPPVRFNISLYGGSNETYRNMCGIPAYEQVKENIRHLRQAGVDVGINLSITPYNKDDLARIHADAVELGVPVKASSYMYPSIRINGGQYGCGNRLSCEDSAKYAVEWDKLRFTEEEFEIWARNIASRSNADESGCPTECEEGVRCRAGTSSFWMTWDGKMTPCGMMDIPAAKPLEMGFAAAWEHIKAETAKIRTPRECAGCDLRGVCGACAAVFYAETGRFDGVSEYVCRRAKELVLRTQAAYEERRIK